MTPREGELLAAVRELLDIPYAADGQFQRYQDEVCRRAAWLCGYLDNDLGALEASRMLAAVRGHAARPLSYEPEQVPAR